MPGTVITLSPHLPLDRAERLVRERVARDGAVELAAKTADRRQVRQLRRLSLRLAADPSLWVFRKDRPDGGTYLTVIRAGSGPVWWTGEAKIDATADSLD
jgi:hypothetical protein